MSNKILNKNLYKMVYNNFILKFIPEVNQFKVQRYLEYPQKNLYNLSYSYLTVRTLFEKNDGFIYIPSELFLKDIESNTWLYNKSKNIVWRPHNELNDSIEVRMLNNSIYLDDNVKHPDIIQPVLVDEYFDKKESLVDISIEDLKSRLITF